MNKELCFIINKQELILEQILVDYNNVPVYFICKDNQNQYYVVLCTDIDNEKYIITKTDINKLIKLLKQKITMRDLILSEKEFWEVTAGESIEKDICKKKNISLIDLEDLPYENSYFKVVTTIHKKFLNELEDILFSQQTSWKMVDVELNSNELEDSLPLKNTTIYYNKLIEVNETMNVEKIICQYPKNSIISYDSDFKKYKNFNETKIIRSLNLDNLINSGGLFAA